jgi:hypothetical protein
MNSERAHNKAYELIASVSTPGSDTYMEDFPGYARLGLDPELPSETIIADAIIYAVRAGEIMQAQGMNSVYAGRLEAMIKYSVVDLGEVNAALSRYRTTAPDCVATKENMPKMGM